MPEARLQRTRETLPADYQFGEGAFSLRELLDRRWTSSRHNHLQLPRWIFDEMAKLVSDAR